MGYDQNGALVKGKIVLKPRNACHIQMVGRLIEDVQFRGGEKKLSKGNSCLLTAGEHRNRLIEFLFAESETFNDTGHLGAEGVAVLLFEGMIQTLIFFVFGVKLRTA